jgi:hypothetical protein
MPPHCLRSRFRIALATLVFVATGAHAAVRDAGEGISVDHGQAAERRGAETLHPARVDRRRFEATGRGAGLELPSTGAATQHARFERSERRHGDYTWIGKVDTEAGEQAVVITFGADATFGTIPQRHGPPLRVESRRGRTWLVEGEARRRMAAGSRSDARIPAAGSTTAGDAPVSAAATTTATTSGTPVIDVLIAYTPSMVTRYGTTSAALTRLSYLESLTNQAYADTPANVRIRVVARQLLNYTAASGNGTVLDLITNPSTNTVKTTIDGWRQQYGADLVSVVRSFETDYMDDCGQGWIGGYHGSSFSASHGFSAVSDGADGGYYCVDQTFAHELGHNMGSHHDAETAGGDYGAYAYSRGYRLTVSSTSGFATVMAYSDGPQTQLNRFSNPAAAACMARPCGVAGSSDNARSLGNTAAAVAAFRAATSSTTPALPSLAVANASVVEGNSGTRALSFRVTLSAASATAVSFDVATANGSATAGSDYVAVPATRLSIAAGATTRDVSVTVNGDTAVEANETLTLTLANPSGATLADASGAGTITNDDTTAPAPTTPSLSINDASLAEGSSGTRSMVFRVSLSSASASTVAFDVSTANGTATAGSDYNAIAPTRVTFAPGVTATNVSVGILGDATPEANETFTVRLANATGAPIADASGTGTISNDDTTVAPAGPGLSIADASVVEGDGGSVYLTFVVTLSKPSTSTVSYTVSTADGSAKAGSDYSARVLASQSIPAGATGRNFNVIVTPDLLDELNETLAATLQSASGATIVDGQATGTIIDDD